MSTILDALTGWTLLSGLILASGAVVARWIVLPRAWPDDAWEVEVRLPSVASVGLAGALMILTGLALYFLRQLLEFRDPFVPWTEDAALLLGTSWGARWKAATVGAVLLSGAFGLARSRLRASWWLATPVALVLAAFPGLTGHAAGVDEGRTLALVADWGHVLAAGAWMGGLAVVLFLSRSRGGESTDGAIQGDRGLFPDLPRLVPAFSPVAVVSVAVLVLSGTYAAWLHLPDIASLLTADYGRLLLGKLLLAALVLAFGARNFRVLTPRLDIAEGREAMQRSAALELAVAQLVLLATALLVRTSPMGS